LPPLPPPPTPLFPYTTLFRSDEARILAALAEGKRFASVDVVAKHVGRSTTRTVLANASSVGAAANITPARNVPTYLTRLHGFGRSEEHTSELQSRGHLVCRLL